MAPHAARSAPITAIPSSTPSVEWIHDREEVFHDLWAEGINPETVFVDESFEACTAPETKQIIKWLGNVQGKRILDVGCGAGEGAVYFAKKGAFVTATDISAGMLRVVQRVALEHRVHVNVKQCSAEGLPFADESFDVVYTGNLLHHVDLEQTLVEMKRVLKPGGVLVSWDPLAHNPLINIYRRIAVDVRTPDEHPLKMSEIRVFERHFKEVKYECFWFFTLWLFINFKLCERIDPNKERYWKKIIKEHKRLEPVYTKLAALDQIFLKCFPFFKRHCWNIALHCVK
jgi:ubiquinone/menaquinone biosynthesis C-methylase UbiE